MGHGHHDDHDHHAPRRRRAAGDRPVRIGIGGPVGSGKTTLVGALCVLLRDELSLAVVTNDIFTTEDAEALRRAAVLPVERIVAVETGCCPHTAIRDDIAANLDAAESLEAALGARRRDAHRVRRRQPDGDLQPRPRRRPGLRARHRRRRRRAAQGWPGRGDGRRARDQQGRPRAVRRRRRRPDAGRRRAIAATGPVLPTSLRTPSGAAAVADWVRAVVAAWKVPADGVRASARVEVARRDGRDVLVDVRSEPPLAVRGAGDRVLLVGQRGGAGRRRRAGARRRRRAGARLSLGTVAATMAWPSPRGDAVVADGAAPTVGARRPPALGARAARARRRLPAPLDDDRSTLAAGATAWIVEEVVARSHRRAVGVADDVVARRARRSPARAPRRAPRPGRARVGERGDDRPAPPPAGGGRRRRAVPDRSRRS